MDEMSLINDNTGEKFLYCDECNDYTIHQCELYKELGGRICEEQICGKCGNRDVICHGY